MLKKIYYFLVFSLILIFFSCGNKNTVEINDVDFGNEIALQQNLTFSLSKDIAPDSILNQWTDVEFISISPKVEGSFSWISPNQLIFSPEKGFAPGKEYEAKLTKKITKLSPEKLSIGKYASIKFSTAPQRIELAHGFWTRETGKKSLAIQIDIDLSYDVNVEEAIPFIELKHNNKNISFQSITSGISKTISIQFHPVSDKDEDELFELTLKKGLKIYGYDYVLEENISQDIIIPSRYKLEINSVLPSHDGVEGSITIHTSQPILESTIRKALSLSPSVSYDISLHASGFIIKSNNLNAQTTYQLRLSKLLEGEFGGKLAEEYSEQIIFGEISPTISFANTKGMYLSSKGAKNIAINIVNIPEVEISVVKVYENNILQLLHGGKDWNYDYDYETDEYNDYSYYDTENIGDEIYKEVISTNKLQKLNAARLLQFNFENKVKKYDGVYIIRVASTQHRYIQDSKIISFSDIGLITKAEGTKIYVFANSIRTATPLSDIEVRLISSTNQVMMTQKTNKNGVAIFENIHQNEVNFKPMLISAKQGTDFSFLHFRNNSIEMSRFDVGGRVPNKNNLNAYIYAERNLYRPGETIHASVIVRTEELNLPGEMPVKLKLVMPNGKEFSTKRKTLNEQGACEVEYDIPKTAMTGTYSLYAYTGNDVLLNTYYFSIEEFMPDRIKVALTAKKTSITINDSIITKIQVDNLYGTPAANRKYEWELSIDKTDFSPKKFTDYNFSIDKSLYISEVYRKGETNAKGSASENYQVDKKYIDHGVLKANIHLTAFDETGRPVHRYEQVQIFTQSIFFGIKHFNNYVTTRQSLAIPLIALNANEKVLNGQTATITVIRKEWQSVIQETYGGKYRYISEQVDKVVKQENISISGENTRYNFTPTVSGDYEIRISKPGSTAYVSNRFYAYGWNDTEYSSFEVNNEGNVDITTDKEVYKLGEEVNVLFTTPFDGKLLVGLERNKVISYEYIDVKNQSASFKFKATEEHLPNIYVSAVLIRPMAESNIPLTVAHGFKNIKIEDEKRLLPLTVSVANSSRSKMEQTIQVKTAPNAYVTIAAVDEGILQIMNYKTPNPYHYFYQKMALSVQNINLYPMLLPEYSTSKSSSGGDGFEMMAGRVDPTFVNRVKNVSFWSGIQKADGSGNLKYTIQVPQFSGSIRVMAVAYKNNAFNGVDQHMKVADPIVISAGLPRFLSPKDETNMSVVLSNTTNKSINASILVVTEGTVSINGAKTANIEVDASSENRAYFTITADNKIGAGKVRIAVKTASETFTHEIEIGVRPAASLQKQTSSGVAEAGKTTKLDLSASFFFPESVKGNIVISNSPLAEFGNNLNYLIRYPHGCTEQTVSAAFPQLYFSDLIKSLPNEEELNPKYNVQQALIKLQACQLPNGALAYWPGGDYETWWGSVFAAHFMLEAKEVGYDVNAQTLNKLLEYLKYKLKNKETITYYYNGTQKRTITAKEVTYSLFVLAKANQAQISTMNYYKANIESLSIDSKYLLSAAYALSGQKQQALQILPKGMGAEKSNNSFGGSFYSYSRDKAIALYALLTIDPMNNQILELSRQVSETLKTQKYLNTQETVFSLLALGKIAKENVNNNVKATVVVNGSTIATYNGSPLEIDVKKYINKTIEIKAEGQGKLYYFSEVSGISEDGNYIEEDNYLKVRRTYFDRNGRQITGNKFKQNDLIVVRLTLETAYNDVIENIAITDMLPAGFEIENTRLNQVNELPWIAKSSGVATPDYSDFRDDRANFFTNIRFKPIVIYYMVRAVSPGKYHLGPVQADAMYNGEFHSYNGSGIVVIEE